MRINVAIPEPHVSAPVLDAALESVTRLNESMLERGEVPTFDKALHYGVRWKPEPPGHEHFDHARKVIGRKWGDCDDLAPWHAASLRHTGADPSARAIAKRSGPSTWHAVVLRGDGTIDDPSKRAGMGTYHRGVVGAALPLMWPLPAPGINGAYIVRPQIALRPVYGGFQARADLPWMWREHLEKDNPSPSDWAMTALHTAPVAASALTGALDGIIELADVNGAGREQDLTRLECLSDACHGIAHRDRHVFERLSDHYDPTDVAAAREVVGSFWSSITRAVAPVVHAVAPIARAAVPFIPGVGPIADAALKYIPGMPGSEGGGGGEAPAAAPGGHGYTCRYF